MRKLKAAEMKRLSVADFHTAPKMPVIIVLDNIRSQNNVGSVFRTADAFRCEAIWLCGITAVPPHREIHKTALGATESVEWLYFADNLEAIRQLRQRNYRIYAVEQTDQSIPLTSFHPELSPGIALVLGNEVSGIDVRLLEAADGSIEIPQYGTKHSLNIAVAAGIMIWDIFQKSGSFF
jgi:23S rRNA (guanosine2251-2'-O)-methyltransferase